MRRTDIALAPLAAPLNAFPLIQARAVDTFCEGITRLFSDSTFDVSVDRKSHQSVPRQRQFPPLSVRSA